MNDWFGFVDCKSNSKNGVSGVRGVVDSADPLQTSVYSDTNTSHHENEQVWQVFRNGLFLYLLNNIETGGPYRSLWPQVARYIKGQVTREEFDRLMEAHLMHSPGGLEVAQ